MPEGTKKTNVKTSGAKAAAGKAAKVAAGKSASAKAAPEKVPAKKLVENRGMFIDFAPGRSRSKVEELNNRLGVSGAGAEFSNVGLSSVRLGSAGLRARQKNPDELPARRPTPDRPIDRPAVPRPPRSKVPIKRKVGITTDNMPLIQRPTKVVRQTTIVATTDNMPAINEPRRNLRVAPRRPTPITRSGAVVMPSAPSAGYTGQKRVNPDREDLETSSRKTNSGIGEDGFFKDSSPLMSDADLAIALAGFADDDGEASPLTDNLSKEAVDFAEEIDALTVADALEDLEEKAQEKEMEDFVSEPKALFEDEAERAGSRSGAKRGRAGESADARRGGEHAGKKEIYRSLYDGESPFLTSVTVEKRPLSGAAPVATEVVIAGGEVVGGRLAKQAEVAKKERKPLKFVRSERGEKNASDAPEYRPIRNRNVYAKRSDEESAEAKPHDTIVIAPDEKGHNLGMIIAILLTILLGAGVGALVYLVFF